MVKKDSIIRKFDEFDVTDLDGEKVIMDLEKGKYFSLNVLGSIIWDLIDKEKSVNDITELLANEYDVDKKSCEEEVLKYLHDLECHKLIKVI